MRVLFIVLGLLGATGIVLHIAMWIIVALHNPGCSSGLKPPVWSSDLAM
jgi:hypothetical protein